MKKNTNNNPNKRQNSNNAGPHISQPPKKQKTTNAVVPVPQYDNYYNYANHNPNTVGFSNPYLNHTVPYYDYNAYPYAQPPYNPYMYNGNYAFPNGYYNNTDGYWYNGQDNNAYGVVMNYQPVAAHYNAPDHPLYDNAQSDIMPLETDTDQNVVPVGGSVSSTTETKLISNTTEDVVQQDERVVIAEAKEKIVEQQSNTVTDFESYVDETMMSGIIIPTANKDAEKVDENDNVIETNDDIQAVLTDNISNDDEIMKSVPIADGNLQLIGTKNRAIVIDDLPEKMTVSDKNKKHSDKVVESEAKFCQNTADDISDFTRHLIDKSKFEDIPQVGPFEPRLDACEAKLAYDKWMSGHIVHKGEFNHPTCTDSYTDAVLNTEQLLTNQNYLNRILNYLHHRVEYEKAEDKDNYQHDVNTAHSNRYVTHRGTYYLVSKYMAVLCDAYMKHKLEHKPYYRIDDPDYDMYAKPYYRYRSHTIPIDEKWGKGDVIAFTKCRFSFNDFVRSGTCTDDYSYSIKLHDSSDEQRKTFDLAYCDKKGSVLIQPIKQHQFRFRQVWDTDINKTAVVDFLSQISLPDDIIYNQNPCESPYFVHELWYDVIKSKTNDDNEGDAMTHMLPKLKAHIEHLNCFIAVHIPQCIVNNAYRKVSDPEIYLIARITNERTRKFYGNYCIIYLKRVMNVLLPVGSPLVYKKEYTENLHILVESVHRGKLEKKFHRLNPHLEIK